VGKGERKKGKVRNNFAQVLRQLRRAGKWLEEGAGDAGKREPTDSRGKMTNTAKKKSLRQIMKEGLQLREGEGS